jgi:hypothetical protein
MLEDDTVRTSIEANWVLAESLQQGQTSRFKSSYERPTISASPEHWSWSQSRCSSQASCQQNTCRMVEILSMRNAACLRLTNRFDKLISYDRLTVILKCLVWNQSVRLMLTSSVQRLPIAGRGGRTFVYTCKFKTSSVKQTCMVRDERQLHRLFIWSCSGPSIIILRVWHYLVPSI